ncbi:hypothetical protein H0I23_04305 [Cellulophaga sp. HaHaR_3_176]|uniref:tetratricopeptide repeat-containing sensor histidine kinase n=1 Tax=Cellulophaga sp. HaHaR_3_176 TaxID=1942464 RepID=UPI001C200490|nr:ATP-binding protein [Cellulophaga sp. HaHaR_3_176]QWX84872.1 hypothetical protein H0I23_04305 [Cellulophaga sp. HaHaR_3_176]
MKFKFSLSLFFIFIYIGFNTVFANDFFKQQSLSIYILSEKSNDSITILKNKIGAFAKNKDYDNAILYSKKLYKKAQIVADSSSINNAIWRQGFYFKKINQLDSAYYYFNKSFTINLKLNDSIAVGDRLLDMANIQKSLGDYNGGMITAIEGIKYIENSTKIKSIIGLYQTISVCHKELGDYKEALRWNDKSINLSKKDSSNLGLEINHTINITRANILAETNKFESSFRILNTIIKNTNKGNQFQNSRALCNIGYYKWLENKNNPESESLLIKSFEKRKKLNTVSGLISSTIHLAEYYFKIDKHEALKYAQMAYQYSYTQNNPVAVLESLDLVLPLKKSLNQDVSEEAILYSKVQNKLEKTKQTVRSIYAATKYDNDTLEKNNLKLLATVATKKKQNSIAFSVTLFLLILIGFIIYYKNHQKNKEQLEAAYKTELRLSKKLHDELGNDIFYLMTQVQKGDQDINTSKNALVLDSLNSIYQRIRDFSKEFTAIHTGDEFGKQFQTLLNSYGSNKTKLITKELASDFWNDITPKTKIEIYRILQELLVNMKKHSNASLVAITCSKNEKQVSIKYVDNGIGFNVKDNYFGNGLKNVENRIKSIKGSINFDSKPNKGFTAIILFTI